MVNINEHDLYKLTYQILISAGADERNAKRVSEALLSANLSGVDTHGVFHLPRYIKEIDEQLLVPTAWPEIINENQNSALIKGNWTFGHVIAKFSMDLAISKASSHQIAVVSFMQSSHIGRLGEYAEMAARVNMISQIWASGYGVEQPVAVPFGGRDSILHTNPISIGIPGIGESHMIMDFATTTVAGSKLRIAHQRGEPAPDGSLVDDQGNPTTDPSTYPERARLTPFGAHKGYSLMLANEFIGRIFSGSDDYSENDRGGPIMRHQGVTMIVMKADLFQPIDEFQTKSNNLQKLVRSVNPASGFDSVKIPGDIENNSRKERKLNGIPIPDEQWESIKNLAERFEVELPV